MTRRSFLRSCGLGVGAIVTLAAIKVDAFAETVGLKKKAGPFPEWTVKWKRFGKSGWSYQSKMHLLENVNPPKVGRRNGESFDLFRFNPSTLTAVYYAR